MNENASSHTFSSWMTRGLILDVFVFVINAFLMGMLVQQFIGVIHNATVGEPVSRFEVTAFFTSFLVLAPAGAFLSRWSFHDRRASEALDNGFLSGCLFNPLIYFGVMVVYFSISAGLILRSVFGINDLSDFSRAILVIVGLLLVGVHTFLAYRYFTPPSPPRTSFMLSPVSGLIGDIFIFTNMLFFQLLWNTLAMGFKRPMNGYDLFTNLLAVSVGGLLIYFPPRMFYLADEIKRPKTWFFIVLANTPIIYRAVFGSGHMLKF